MFVKNVALYLSLIFLLGGCIAKSKIDITLKNNKSKQLGILNLNVAQVSVVNDQLVVDGSNLNGITSVKLVRNGVEQTLTVESSSASQLIANGITAVTLNVGQVFDMILSTANAAATVPVIFSLNNNSVTAAHLTSMGALSGQVLKFNGTSWAPASLIDAQLYKGTWDPGTLLPDVGLSSPGDYWVISAAGTNAGNGITYAVGDWIISDGYSWSKLALSKTSVTSFNGRKGLVNLIPGDYSSLKSGAKIPGSSLNDLANVDITTVAPINGDVLKFNGTNWVAGSAGGGGGGSVGSTEITDLSITGGDIAENTINPSKIYSSSIDSALYLRGDKTWANFAADVLNVPLSTYALDATTKPTVLATDRIGPALGKVQKFLNDLNTDYMSKTALTQTVTGTFSFTSPTSFLYTQLPTGTNPNEAANVQYVQNYVTSAVSSGGGYAPGTLTTASAATSGDTTLTVTSTTGYPPAGTLLVGSEAIIYTGKTATTFTGLTRGAFGTTAAAISGGATVNNYVLMGKSTETVTPKMVVTGSGNVGIGTTNPGALLQLGTAGTSLGTLRMTGSTSGFTQIQPAAAAGSWTMTLPSGTGTNGQVLQTNGSGITSWGTVPTNGGTFLAGDGTDASPSYSFSSDPDTGILNSWTNEIAISTGGARRVVISNAYMYVTTPFWYHQNNSNVYAPSSGAQNYPEGSTIRLSNTNTTNGAATHVRYETAKGSAWIGAVNPSSGSTPPIVFTQQAGASSYSESMRIDSSGNVGIGTTNPGYKLQVGIAADGSEARANAWNTLSDERLKKDFELIPDSLEKILSLNGYYYHWNRGSDTSRKMGVKAQEVEKVFPEIVSHGNDGFLSVSYNHLVAAVIQALKDFFFKWQADSQSLHREIASVKEQNKMKDKEIKKLKSDNEAIKAYICSKDSRAPICK